MAEQETDGAPGEGQAEGAKESLADDIGKAYDDLMAAAEAETEPADEVEAAEAETTETESEETEGDEDADLEASDDGEEPGEDNAELEGDEDTETVAEAPEHWSQDDKDAFGELPDEAKSLYLDKAKSLEAGYGRKFEELAAERKGIEPYREFQEVFRPFENDLATAGITAAQYTRQLVATALQMRQDPEGTIKALASQHGVSLSSGKPDNGAGPAPDAGDDGIDEFTDPAVIALRDRYEAENRKLREAVDGLSSKFDQSQTAQEVSQQQQVENAWASFVDAKGEDGSELHPGAADLRARVAYELQIAPPAGGETTEAAFQRAYDDVKWSAPGMRETLLEAERTARTAETDKATKEAEREKKRKADLAKAKKAGRTVKSKSAPVSEAPAPAKTNREELERQWDRQMEQSG